ncbi:DUF1643 domain-containing protein [Labrys okinawensis]|uniref:DUF1643 domain-containing protein n=1 Tax=Labrys okinawensis TaxID=346911 RepID=UPI0039BC44D7
MSARDLRHHRARRQRLFNDPHLLVARPATAALNSAQNFNPHQPTLRLALKPHASPQAVTMQGGPRRRHTNDDPVAVDNQRHVRKVLESAGPVVCAWGAHGGHLGQDETMLGWLGPSHLYAVKITAAGHPAHPLYLPRHIKLKTLAR